MGYRELFNARYAGKSDVYTAFATGRRSANDTLLDAIIAAAYSDAPDTAKLARIRSALGDSWAGAAEYARSFDVEVE